jgi:rhodanese-related sulfurtransferase
LAIESLDGLDDLLWLDLRSRAAFESWHPEGALHLSFPAALDGFTALDPSASYLAYCEVGLKSAQLAEVMSAAGYRARHVAGGFRRVMRWAEQRLDPALRAALSPVLLD